MVKYFLIFIVAFNIYSQKCSSINDPKLLSKVQTSYSKLTSFEAEFSQVSFLDALNTSENSSGIVYYEKPGKMNWTYQKPEKQIFVIDNEKYFLYQVDDNQVMIDNLRNVLVSDLPVSFLLGVGDLNNNFQVIEQKKCDNFVIKMKSKNDPAIKELILEVGKDYLPKVISILDSSNNRNTISLSNYKKNKSIKKELFEEEFPKGTDINDKRGLDE